MPCCEGVRHRTMGLCQASGGTCATPLMFFLGGGMVCDFTLKSGSSYKSSSLAQKSVLNIIACSLGGLNHVEDGQTIALDRLDPDVLKWIPMGDVSDQKDIRERHYTCHRVAAKSTVQIRPGPFDGFTNVAGLFGVAVQTDGLEPSRQRDSKEPATFGLAASEVPFRTKQR